MATKTDIIVKPTPDLTPDQARNIRARAWSYIFHCHWKHKAAEGSGSEDRAKGGSENGSTT